jgi:hypothetical protein
MTWSTWIASAAVVVMGTFNTGVTQTPVAIANFEDVAGKWAGHANTYAVSLDLDTNGRFIARYALGSERGAARLEGGNLVIPLPRHNGALQLSRDGETLKGPGIVAGKTWQVSLARKAAR